MPPSDDLPVSPLSRRALLAGAASAGLLAALGRAEESLPNTSFRASLSLSPFAESVLSSGISFSDGHRVARSAEELQRLFVAHGSTEVYARFGTRRKFTPGEGDHSVECGLGRAHLAKKLGLPFNPELGLFAFYGDVTHQPEPDFSDYPQIKLPKAWHRLEIEQMTPVLRDYGALIAAEIVATGAHVNYWDLGNEVEFGVAGIAMPSLLRKKARWTYRAPDAVDPEIGRMDIRRYLGLSEDDRLAWLSSHLWPNMAKAFRAVAEGIRSVDKSARFSTHLSGLAAYSPRFLVGFFKAMDEGGYRVDQLGLSYYPTSASEPDRRFDRFKAMAAYAHDALQRPIFLAEYGYPVGPFKFGADSWDHPVSPYSISPQGQSDFTRDLVAWGAATGHMAGIRPWAPDLVVPGWGEMSFFDLRGKTATARSGLDAISAGLAIAGKPLAE